MIKNLSESESAKRASNVFTRANLGTNQFVKNSSLNPHSALRRLRHSNVVMLLLVLTGCGKSSGEGAISVTPAPIFKHYTRTGKFEVSFAPNRESGVNSPGGGYKIYYGRDEAVSSATPFINVPFSGEGAAPSARFEGLESGTYHIHVVAYSALNPSGSNPVKQAVVVVP